MGLASNTTIYSVYARFRRQPSAGGIFLCLTSLVKMAVFTKFFLTSSALPAPSARLPCQQGGGWKFKL